MENPMNKWMIWGEEHPLFSEASKWWSSQLGFVSAGDFFADRRMPHCRIGIHHDGSLPHFVTGVNVAALYQTRYRVGRTRGKTLLQHGGGASFKKKRWKSTPALYAFKIECINIPISVSFRKGICNLKSVCMFVFSWEAFGKLKTMKCREKQRICVAHEKSKSIINWDGVATGGYFSHY